MKRLAGHEKFSWRGFEFRQSICNSQEIHWEMRHGQVRVRLIYRDIGDPETPPEFTAIIHVHGLAEGQASHTGGAAVAASHEQALARAEKDFRDKLILGLRLSNLLRKGATPGDPATEIGHYYFDR